MPLSCSCDYDYEPEFGMWNIKYWEENYEMDFEPLKTSKRKRCCSCKKLIDIGSLCIRFPRVRYPNNEIEAKIVGLSPDPYEWEDPTIDMSAIYQCEKCGEIYLNLDSVGFECIYPTENMPKMLKDYQVEYAPPKLNLIKHH